MIQHHIAVTRVQLMLAHLFGYDSRRLTVLHLHLHVNIDAHSHAIDIQLCHRPVEHVILAI